MGGASLAALSQQPRLVSEAEAETPSLAWGLLPSVHGGGTTGLSPGEGGWVPPPQEFECGCVRSSLWSGAVNELGTAGTLGGAASAAAMSFSDISAEIAGSRPACQAYE